MREHARIVIIGGGIVGCSIAYHLTKLGEKDVLLLERTELTAGSTWHAAGLLPLFNMSYSTGQLHKYSVDLYKTLEEETGQAVSFHQTGNLRLACTKERLDEYHNYCGIANTIGVPFRMVTPAEIKDLWPLCNTDDLLGALFHPEDGHVAPADVTMALAKGARTRGCEIALQTEVKSIERKISNEWLVKTTGGDVSCEIVISASGNYARQTAAMVGLDIPVIPVEHQYIVTDDVEELRERKRQGLPEMAVLREPDSSYYLREERQGYILGPYERGAQLCFADGVPANFGRELFPGDIDRLAPHIEGAIHRVPSFASAGIKDVVNGPISYTPDGNPLLGRAWGLRDFYFAEGFSFGITAAGGAGKVLAELIVEGESSIDTLPLDPRRFGAYADKDYASAKNVEAYENVYTVHYPMEERPAARNRKQSPCHTRLDKRGAVWGQRYGWERANWFAPAGVERSDIYSFRRSNWFSYVGAECRASRDSVGLIDLTGFSKFDLLGQGAGLWFRTMIANNVPKKDGRIQLGHNLYSSGGVRSEFTVTRLSDQHYYIVSSGAAERFDDDLLFKCLPPDGSLRLENNTLSRGTFVLCGPQSRALLGELTDADLSNEAFPWLSAQTLTIAGQSDVRALRVNFVGELGWELHHPLDSQNALFEAIVAAGERHGIAMVGMRAMDSMRIEKSYRMWGQELTADYTPIQAGLERFVKLKDNVHYLGSEKLLQQQEHGCESMFVTVAIDVDDADALGNEPVYSKSGKMVGRLTSGGYGHRIDKSLGLGYLDSEYAALGTEVEVLILDKKFGAIVIEESPYDSANAKLRA